jgi:hypothetical protein
MKRTQITTHTQRYTQKRAGSSAFGFPATFSRQTDLTASRSCGTRQMYRRLRMSLTYCQLRVPLGNSHSCGTGTGTGTSAGSGRSTRTGTGTGTIQVQSKCSETLKEGTLLSEDRNSERAVGKYLRAFCAGARPAKAGSGTAESCSACAN